MNSEEVQLLRGGSVVSSFSGAFGASLRETRLTAILGYLIALKPEVICEKFGITGKIISVALETQHDQGRSDILIKSTDGLAVVEAKIDGANPSEQANKYGVVKWQVLLTEFMPTTRQKKNPQVIYCRWRDIANIIRENTSEFSTSKARFVSQDFIMYLKEHHMIPDDDADEIYARDITEDYSVNMFLKGHVYGCSYEEGSRLFKTHYFAPYFGKRISASTTVQNLHPGLQAGISYIAKIITFETCETPSNFEEIAKQWRIKTGYKKAWKCPKEIKFFFGGKQYTYCFILLDKPRLAFNPPIQKKYLQKFPRYNLNKQFWAFDELYKHWERQKQTMR